MLIVIKVPGARVLYLGAASGTSVSHVSDIVGPVSADMSIYSNCNSLFNFLFSKYNSVKFVAMNYIK